MIRRILCLALLPFALGGCYLAETGPYLTRNSTGSDCADNSAQYRAFGCATAHNLAQQVAQPLDLTTGRTLSNSSDGEDAANAVARWRNRHAEAASGGASSMASAVPALPPAPTSGGEK